MLIERAAIRPLVENDRGVQGRVEACRRRSPSGGLPHASRMAELPVHANSIASAPSSLTPSSPLSNRWNARPVQTCRCHRELVDRHAARLQDAVGKRLPGVIEGWVDAIADAVEDDDQSRSHL